MKRNAHLDEKKDKRSGRTSYLIDGVLLIRSDLFVRDESQRCEVNESNTVGWASSVVDLACASGSKRAWRALRGQTGRLL